MSFFSQRGLSVPACITGDMTRGSLSREVSVGVSVWEGLCLAESLSGGLCPGVLCLKGLCPGSLCPERSLSRGLSVLGVFVRETPCTVKSGQY